VRNASILNNLADRPEILRQHADHASSLQLSPSPLRLLSKRESGATFLLMASCQFVRCKALCGSMNSILAQAITETPMVLSSLLLLQQQHVVERTPFAH